MRIFVPTSEKSATAGISFYVNRVDMATDFVTKAHHQGTPTILFVKYSITCGDLRLYQQKREAVSQLIHSSAVNIGLAITADNTDHHGPDSYIILNLESLHVNISPENIAGLLGLAKSNVLKKSQIVDSMSFLLTAKLTC